MTFSQKNHVQSIIGSALDKYTTL